MDGKEFLKALWPDIPQGCGLQMWRLSDKKTFTFPQTDAAAGWAGQHQESDIYLGAGLSPVLRQGPSVQRIFARDVAGIPGLWADIDVNGGPEGKTGAAPDMAAAESLAHFALEPTIIVNSGYGIQAWWLLEEPWVFFGDTGADERNQAATIVRAYQAVLRDQAKSEGYGLDSTHDLARLMRIPGTNNCKGAMAGAIAPVTVVYDDGPRHSIEAFVEVTRDYMAVSMETMRKATGEGIEIELRDGKAQPPMMRIEELGRISDEFRFAWNHGQGFPGRPPTKSMNEWDMSIANHLAWAGFNAQDIADCLTYHRIRFGDQKNKRLRMDYMKRTIGKALASVELPSDEDDLEAREDNIDELSREGTKVHPDPARTVHLFSQIVGGPEIKRLIQDGLDPEHVQYRLELADGSEVPLPGPEYIIEQSSFKKQFMVVTGHLLKRLKNDEWDKAVRALLKTATVNDVDSREAIVQSWLDGYLDYGLSTDRDGACQAMDPFVVDGKVAIHAGNLGLWLRRNRGLRMKDTEIHQYLHAAGFERKSISYTRDDGKRNMRSYWVTNAQSAGISEM